MVDAPHQCPLGVGSKLPLPLYADVRLHILMTHHNDVMTHHNDIGQFRWMGDLKKVAAPIAAMWQNNVVEGRVEIELDGEITKVEGTRCRLCLRVHACWWYVWMRWCLRVRVGACISFNPRARGNMLACAIPMVRAFSKVRLRR